MEWLDKLPISILVVVAVLMALAPFTPEPHLWEKYKMLRAGTLSRPLDIFDVFWHLLPTMLLIAKLVRMYR
ncbi:MAG: RND transporter [Rhodospirillaceae bacterium]|jgi:hypothetical protein|nr:RND transporter [Rhodospirillaceae bacterium]